jgi:hypothetical protein
MKLYEFLHRLNCPLRKFGVELIEYKYRYYYVSAPKKVYLPDIEGFGELASAAKAKSLMDCKLPPIEIGGIP